MVAAATASLLALVLLPLLGAKYAPQQTVDVWSLLFGAITVPSSLLVMLTPGARLKAGILLALALVTLIVVRSFALPVATDLGLVPEPITIVPLAS